MKVRITIRDLAREAGVSVGTASRALNRAGRVSERAIVAVTTAAHRLPVPGHLILSGVLHALRQGGRRVPADATVISIGDADLSQLFNPAISSLTWDLDAVGQALAQLLLKRVGAGQPMEPQRIVVTTRLMLRESCAGVTIQTRPL